MPQKSLAQFIAQNRLSVGLWVLAVIVALFLASKILLDVVHFNDPRHQDEALRNWMTPRYVVKSYDLPRPLVDDIFELDPNNKKREKMRHIAKRLNLTLEELTERVRLSAKAHRDSL